MTGDITFNSDNSYFGGNFTTYVRNNMIPESRVDDMAESIIAAWFLLHQDSPDYPNVPVSHPSLIYLTSLTSEASEPWSKNPSVGAPSSSPLICSFRLSWREKLLSFLMKEELTLGA
ncbi:hypothetical protein K435DRAFT_875335 [Dendrothele bispora CBS 962.96]|uniref:Uncharacterized protein n=1 Tax=Dendrothele bispora (strain CBS 962.96) TaxID=1314807 RepID=A0A4S8KUK1_DENBC|nr:hypothetical protein K435DRAFT_875335 [Dendrothele bispora CBS 962.96]